MEQEKGWNMEKGVESYLDISQMRLLAEGNWEYEQEPRMIREDGSIKEVWTGGSFFRWEHGQKEAAPRLVESCMMPGKCYISPLHVFLDEDILVLERKWEQVRLSKEEAKGLMCSPWKPERKKKSCIPCRNCGACSW